MVLFENKIYVDLRLIFKSKSIKLLQPFHNPQINLLYSQSKGKLCLDLDFRKQIITKVTVNWIYISYQIELWKWLADFNYFIFNKYCMDIAMRYNQEVIIQRSQLWPHVNELAHDDDEEWRWTSINKQVCMYRYVIQVQTMAAYCKLIWQISFWWYFSAFHKMTHFSRYLHSWIQNILSYIADVLALWGV